MAKTLKEIKHRLAEALTILTNIPNPSSNPKGDMQNHSGLGRLREGVGIVSELGLFPKVVDVLKNSIIFATSRDNMPIQNSDSNTIRGNLVQLQALVENLIYVLNQFAPDDDVNSVNIKLPPVKDFDELSKSARDFHIVLSQVLFNDEIKGETRIVSVENGSIWLNVFVGFTAITVVASLAWAAAVIYKKILEGRLLQEQVRGLKIKNNSLEDIENAQKQMLDMMLQAEAEHIQSEHFKENSPENLERIKNSVSMLAGLIDKGAEIHPAFVAPENVANLFPDIKNVIGLESKIKKLSQ
jgi:hypothetical protein